MEKEQCFPPHYVYELRDPRNNTVFYVGEGQGDRIYAHEVDEKDDNNQLSPKSLRISEIKEAGKEYQSIIIGRFDTKAEALAVESTLIKWIYGIEILTNRIHGHRQHFVRKTGVFDEIPGIDMERSDSRTNNGEYSDKQRQLALTNGVEEKLEALRDYLKPLTKKYGATVNNPDMLRPMDPKLVIHINDQVVMVDVKLQLTGKDVVIKLVHRPGKDNAETFSKFITTLGRAEEIKKAKTIYRYFWFDGNGKIPIDNSEAIWDRVSNGLTMIKGASETT